jgi:16S rRNA processing protein RimM
LLERFTAGLLGAPFGLKGFIKVRSLSGETEHLLALRQATVRQGDGLKVYEVEAVAKSGPAVLIKFKGIETPEAAKFLSGAELIVNREEAAALGEDEYYAEDLRGIQVVTGDGEILGTVTGIVEGGGGELLEMLPLSGEKPVLIPFRKEFIGEVSPDKGRAVLLQRWILE